MASKNYSFIYYYSLSTAVVIACMPQATSLINFNHNFAKNSYKQKVKLSVELTLITNFATTLFNVCLIFSLANN